MRTTNMHRPVSDPSAAHKLAAVFVLFFIAGLFYTVGSM